MAETPNTRPPMKDEIELRLLEDEVRRRAHQLYEERGRVDGHDLDDWLRAEDEVIRALRASFKISSKLP